MNFRQNMDIPWNSQDVAPPAVMASNSNFDRDHRAAWRPPPPVAHQHPQQQQFARTSHSASVGLSRIDCSRSSFAGSAAGYPSPSPADIYAPASPMHIELPQLANPSLGLNNTMGSQPYMTPSSSISSPPAQPIASEMAKETAVVSVATTFYPGNPDVFPAPDTILSSDDGTLFYLNSQLLAGVGFKVPSSTPLPGIPLDNVTPLPQSPFLPTGSVAKLPDSSITLSIIFHSLYNLSSASLSPALPALSHAISRMSEYSLTPCGIIQPGTALYVDLMTQHAPLQALQLYALAGKHGIEPLAVDVSSHLLGLNLSEITDEVATAMGSVYLKRLFFMHKGRVERLKSVLAKPPLLHADKVADCDSDKQGALRRKWALLVTSLAWDARPDISPHAIKQHLRITGDSIPCKSCRSGWMERVGEASTEWATVKFTI